MYLVTEGKRKENQLGYAPKTKEYVYIHKGVEIWRMKGDESLLNYFSEVRSGIHMLEESDIEKLSTYPIWKRYDDDCNQFDLKELGLK